MLIIETNYGNFVRLKDILTFMEEENLKVIEFYRIEYFFDEIYGVGIYTIDDIRAMIFEQC